jgi:hypothetical protein
LQAGESLTWQKLEPAPNAPAWNNLGSLFSGRSLADSTHSAWLRLRQIQGGI